ncbi:N-acetylmuramoyl-L-alanine amidase, partial [Paenibacillus phytohabitans]|uniref:N-acetylmuramoyl-L-alanine amidase n=1 Tax=Paenibacillus phytohabitans TaxID=2654978 RepID=UPI003008C9DC
AYTLEAALYVQRRLNELGIASDVTRAKDVTLNPEPRTSKVKKYKKCISHHFNAGGGNGAETIHSIYSDGKFEHWLIEEFKKAGYPVRPRPVYTRKNAVGGDYYYMHRLTGACRTTILEYEFVDGPQSEKIKNKAYREGMYECVVRAICREEGVKYGDPRTHQTSSPKPKPAKKKLIVDGYFNA